MMAAAVGVSLLVTCGCRNPQPYGPPPNAGQPAAFAVPPAQAAVPAVPPGQPGQPGLAAVPTAPPPPPNKKRGLFPNLARPRWMQPGTMQQQQQRAAWFDPYGDNDAAPEIVGGRPREFQRPLAQPVRSQSYGALGLPR